METAELTRTGLNPEGFAVFLARRAGEPAWMTEQRTIAWDLFQNLPMPTRKDEEWRRVDLRSIRFDDIAPFAPVVGARSDRPEVLQARVDLGPHSDGLLIQRNSEDIHSELSAGLRAKGVIWCGFDEAVRRHEDIVRTYYGTVRPPAGGKFTALHYAFQSGGAFLYVPPGVQIDVPLRNLVFADAPGFGLFPHTLIVLDRGARLTYFEERVASRPAPGARQNLVSSVAEIHMKDGAQIRFMSLQEYDPQTYNFSSEKAVGGRDASVAWLTAELGGKLNKGFIDCDLTGSGGRCELLGLYFINGRQQSDIVTLLTHKAPHTEGNILYKGVCDDFARSGFRGRIVVQHAANQTQSFLADHTMLLSDKSRSDSVPTLEIEANDVVCKHAATVGEISEEELFYLRSRGIPEALAKKMIILGFYEEVLKGVPAAALQERVRRALQAKFDMRDHDTPDIEGGDMEWRTNS
ncbi:MAG: Fe-S cluster assembly protein SufD [Candidatus Lindowbacteria bacterium RIFCSPLOWO2_12_FULL_62_27]|nr:MAG: Fe-S cluster assembly protein SufD [Candidatus Lindowbacteria bacterium RIFCSPLOWO2_02_FULL_62_12]OGH62448.1 MAG: Fe-S cluster assembly protein SufD [Candidatus Lindowbacteria bacterium RIFCSPLOWO2_12_FULL_62_27]